MGKIPINFEWHSAYTTEQQKKEIEVSMKKEIIEKNLKTLSHELFVSLFDLPHSQILTGVAVNENGEEIIKITLRLPGNTLIVPNPDYEYC